LQLLANEVDLEIQNRYFIFLSYVTLTESLKNIFHSTSALAQIIADCNTNNLTMVSFASLRTAARRHVMPMFVGHQRQQRRNMALGGHHGPPPEWEGVDKVVRGYFPEDYQCT
jgi:hypothetical protein